MPLLQVLITYALITLRLRCSIGHALLLVRRALFYVVYVNGLAWSRVCNALPIWSARIALRLDCV